MDPIAAVSQADTPSQISIRVARVALDAEQQQGAAAIELLRQAAQLQAQTLHEQGRLDVYG
jgi:hypothetical protein